MKSRLHLNWLLNSAMGWVMYCVLGNSVINSSFLPVEFPWFPVVRSICALRWICMGTCRLYKQKHTFKCQQRPSRLLIEYSPKSLATEERIHSTEHWQMFCLWRGVCAKELLYSATIYNWKEIGSPQFCNCVSMLKWEGFPASTTSESIIHVPG